jgi:glycosyltransferase involved in cell wall biosynthesis
MITTSFPRWKDDGQGTFILDLARAIMQEGVQVQVIAMHTPGAATYECIDGVKIHRPKYWWPEKLEMLRKEGGGLPATLRKHPWILWQIFPFIAIQTLTLLNQVDEEQIVHAHWTLSASISYLSKLISRSHLPIIASVHGSDIFQVIQNPIGAILTSFVLQRCDRVVGVSQALINEVLKLGISSNKVLVISNGVDVERFKPLPLRFRQNIILYVGSLIERKGLKFLLSALPNVFKSFPSYRLLIVGEGPQYPELKRMSDSLNITDKVIFLGFQSHERVRTLMQLAKLFVLPSTEEAQGVVLLEALACGTPVVASKVGGIPEVITSDVGILVPCANSGALSEAIVSILSDNARWLNMSEQARTRAENLYSWKRIARQWISVYEEVLTL